MSCVNFTPAQGRSRGRAPLFLIQEYPRLPGFPSDVYGIMTQRSDSARPRPYAELNQALHTLGGGVMYSCLEVCAWSHDDVIFLPEVCHSPCPTHIQNTRANNLYVLV